MFWARSLRNDLLRSYEFCQFEYLAVREGLVQASVARHLIHFDIIDRGESPLQKPGREALNCFQPGSPQPL